MTRLSTLNEQSASASPSFTVERSVTWWNLGLGVKHYHYRRTGKAHQPQLIIWFLYICWNDTSPVPPAHCSCLPDLYLQCAGFDLRYAGAYPAEAHFNKKKKKNILGGYTMSHFCTSDSISSVVGAMIGVFCRARFAVLTDFHSKLIKTCQQFCVCWTEMTVSDDLSTCSNARQCSLWVTTLFGQLSFGCAIDWWARLPARQLHREGWSWPWLPCSGLLWYQNRALSHRWSALSSPHDASNMAEVRTTEGGRQKRRRERKIYCYWAVK